MEVEMKLYKYYNLGKTIKNLEIKEKFNLDNLERINDYSLDNIIENPEYVSYPEPINFKYILTGKNVNAKIKVFKYGAMSIVSNIKYDVDSLDDFHELIKNDDPRGQLLDDYDKIYRKIINKYENYNDNKQSKFNYRYTVYSVSNKEISDTKDYINNNENIIVSLLTDEYNNLNFSQEQIETVLNFSDSYFKDDYAVVHWNNAFFIDNEKNINKKLFIIELANIHFLKLKTYDSYIDIYLNDYISGDKNKSIIYLPFIKSGISKKINEISDFRVEIEKFLDIIDNFEKFNGNWYLARLYHLANKSFQIDRWKDLIDKRINNVTELYKLYNSEINRKRMLFLNIMMLLFFVLWFLGI